MKLRKVLSIILAVCMVLSSVSVAFAGEVQVNDPETVAVEETEVADEKIEQATVSEESVSEEETPEASPSEDDEIEVVKTDIVLEATAKDGMKVTLEADDDTFEYSEGLTLLVETVDEEVAEEASEQLEKETKNDNVAKRVTYDIKVMHDGEEIQPVDGKKVTVEFTMTDIPSGADAVNVYHHAEEDDGTVIEPIVEDVRVNEGNAETDAVVVSEGESAAKSVSNTDTTDEVDEDDIPEDADIVDDVTVSGETDSFSLYTVDFTYDDITVSIPGGSTDNKLADIVMSFGITDEIINAAAYQDAECTEPAENNEVKNASGDVLYRVYESDGVWYADAVNAFSTEHGLVVKTKDEAEYKIKVTDPVVTSNYLKFTAKEDDIEIKLVKEGSPDAVNLEYSTDGNSWYEFQPWRAATYFEPATGSEIKLTNTNDYVMIRASSANDHFSTLSNYYHFAISGGQADVSGDVTTLLNSSGVSDLSGSTYDYCFNFLFEDCGNLQSVQNLKLPATELSKYCYMHMFNGCTSLTTAPELPATILAEGCYANMFQNCTSLTTTPELTANTLADYCYNCMFFGCTSLESAKELPATTLATNSYTSMFAECSSLTTAPTLRATTLAEGCCLGMFNECSSLTTAPALQAETMAAGCYQYMFVNCISLTTAPALPATALADDCYSGMFFGCSGLETAPALPAETMAENCYLGMFAGCSGLETAPALPIKTLAKECCNGMFLDCTSLKVNESGETGIFTCPSTIPDDAVTDMFTGTTGTFTAGTPIAGHTYYYPVSQYTVTLNGNGASTAGTASVQAIYGNAMPTITNLPTRSGYSFDGYYNSTSTGNKYYNADGTSARNWDIGTNTTLYAQWIKNDEPKSSESSHSSSYTTGWHQSGTNWQYVKPDGSFAKNEWVQIEVNGIKQWYHFGNDTNMDTGWLRDTDGSWYYLSKEQGQNIGTMQTGWMTDPQDGHRYYLDPKTGKMATGWTVIDGKKYYFSEGAATESGWTQNESSDWVYSKRDSIPLGALIQ